MPLETKPLVCIQGLGFVGAAMAVAVAAARDETGRPAFRVRGVDLDTPVGRERVRSLNAGKFPFKTTDELLVQAVAEAHSAGNLDATVDRPGVYADADVVVVDIHFDVSGYENACDYHIDFSSLRTAVRTIGEQVRPGTLVVVETTVPPGTCAKVVAPELAAAMERRGLPPDAVLLAHSYERVMPGQNYLDSIRNYWRVYAGHTPAAADACEAFLSQVINVANYPLTRLASTTASETAKVMENSYRAANIAFIEEWVRFAEVAGIDLFEVIEAIRLRPTHSNIRQPGFGVGGYCLTKDPLFPGLAARHLFDRPDLTFPFCETAVRINRMMPLATLDRVETMLAGDLNGKRIVLLGVTYRQDVADTRYSPSQIFVEEAWRRGAQVVAHDPLITHWEELDLPVVDRLPEDGADALVLAVPHSAYATLDLLGWLGNHEAVVVDANNVLSPAQRLALVNAGVVFASIGRG